MRQALTRALLSEDRWTPGTLISRQVDQRGPWHSYQQIDGPAREGERFACLLIAPTRPLRAYHQGGACAMKCKPTGSARENRKQNTKVQTTQNQPKPGGTDSVSPEVVTLNAKRNNDGINSIESRQRQPGGRDPECDMKRQRG